MPKDFNYVKEFPIKKTEKDINVSLYWFSKEWLKNGLLIGQKIIDKAQDIINKDRASFESGKFIKDKMKIDPVLLPVFNDLKKSNLFKDNRYKELMEIVKLNSKINPMIVEELKLLEKFENEIIFNEIYGHRKMFIEVYLFVHLLVQTFRFLEKLKNRLPLFESIYEEFSINIKHIKEVRNIFEHYDEYITGGGRYKDKNIILKKDRSLMTDATSLYVKKDHNFKVKEIIIGGRVKVKHSIDIMKKVLSDLIILYKRNETLFLEDDIND
jgi:hypothetical protein